MSNSPHPWQEAVRPSPFHGAAASHSLTNEWLRRGAYTVADVYSTVEQEYDALRAGAGLVDHSPLNKVRISGKNARPFLNRLLTGNADDLPLRQSLSSLFCNDAGHVIGLARLLRVHVEEYHLYTEENHTSWLWDTAKGYNDIQIDNFTHDTGVLGIFGRQAADILLAAGADGAEELEPSHHDAFMLRQARLRILKTMLMGEPGYYLYVDPKDALLVWETLMKAGEAHGLAPVGRRAQDICRIEAGELRAGTDFIGALEAVHGNRPRSPFECGLDALVDLEKDHFVGLRALSHGAHNQKRTSIVCLRVEGTEAVTGARILSNGQLIGVVTSSAWSPSLGHVAALATVAAGNARPGEVVQIEFFTTNELEPETRKLEAIIVEK